jgi:elongation factor P
MTINLDGTLFTILWFQHHKPGKGNTVVRSKLRNVLTGAVLEKTFRAGERIDEVRLEHRPMTYSYSDGHLYHFMDSQSYDDVALTAEVTGEDQLKYRKDGQWHPVKATSTYGVAKDTFNEVTFEPVQTEALRIEVQLRDDVSAGILEWQVE